MSEEPNPVVDVLTNPSLTDPSAMGGSALLGQISAETASQPSEFRALVNRFSEATTDIINDRSLDATQKGEAIDSCILENDVWGVVVKGDYNAEEFSDFLWVTHTVAKQTGVTMTSIVATARQSVLDELYQARNHDLIGMIKWHMYLLEANPDSYMQVVKDVEKITYSKTGRMIDWASKGIPRDDLTRDQLKLLHHDEFPTACVSAEFDWIVEQSTGKPLENRLKLRKAEKEILDVFGVPPQMSRDFRLSLRARTVPKKDGRKNGTLLEFNEVGGINRKVWTTSVANYCKSIRHLGKGSAEALSRECGIVNFDRYDPEMLNNQSDLLDRADYADYPHLAHLAKETIKEDITVIFADAFGDYNNWSNSHTKHLNPKTTLVFEIHKPDDYMRYFELLKKANIQPSRMIISAHGGIGRLAYGIDKNGSFVTSYNSSNANTASVQTLGFGQFIREGMRPDSISGEREIFVYACYGAQGQEDIDSIAEAIIKETEPADKAVAKAAEESVALIYESDIDSELFYKERETTFRRRASNYLRNMRGVRRFVGPPKGPKPKYDRWEVAQTVEHRRGTRPGEVVKSRPAKGTPLRRSNV